MLFRYMLLSVFFTALLAVSCSDTFTMPVLTTTGELRDAADARGFLFGGAYHDYTAVLEKDAEVYKELLSSEFNMISCEYSMSMDEIWITESGEYNWKYADRAAAFAEDNSMEIRGTHLSWYSTLPEWITSGSHSTAELETIFETYITDIMTRYAGKVKYWNVVNEVIDHNGSTTYRDTFLIQKLTSSYIASFFNQAYAADSTAKLFINDYGILGNETDNGAKADQLYGVVDALLSGGVPVHGVGLQGHMAIDESLDDTYNAATIQRFVDLGLEVHITELDILINNDRSGITPQKLQDQADMYENIVSLCLDNPGCTAVNLWGSVDKYHYINRKGGASWLDQKKDWPVLFDFDYQPKPAYTRLVELIAPTP